MRVPISRRLWTILPIHSYATIHAVAHPQNGSSCLLALIIRRNNANGFCVGYRSLARFPTRRMSICRNLRALQILLVQAWCPVTVPLNPLGQAWYLATLAELPFGAVNIVTACRLAQCADPSSLLTCALLAPPLNLSCNTKSNQLPMLFCCGPSSASISPSPDTALPKYRIHHQLQVMPRRVITMVFPSPSRHVSSRSTSPPCI